MRRCCIAHVVSFISFMSISIEYFNDVWHNVNRRTGGILMKIFKNLENGSVVEGLLMDVVP